MPEIQQNGHLFTDWSDTVGVPCGLKSHWICPFVSTTTL